MTEESVQGYRHPGDVELESVYLITSNGNPVDVTDLIETINVYQNIFRHYLECEVVFHDASKLLHNLPWYKGENFTGGFSGTEIFLISYKEKSKGAEKEPKVYTHTFRMHNVSDRQSIDNSEAYLMSGISEEAYQTQGKKISKAYGGSSGKTTEEMIKSVFTEYFKNSDVLAVYNSLSKLTYDRINKQLITSPSIGIHKFVIPNYSVDDTIRFFARESDCATRIPYFVFYEDSENFNFVNLNTLTAQEPVDEYWYSQDANVGTHKESDKIHDAKNIIGYKVNNQFDLLKNLNGGLYKARTTRLDMLKKNKKEVVYDYQTYAPKFNRLQEKIVQGIAEDREPVLSLMTTRFGHDIDPLFEGESPRPKRLEQIKDIKNSYRNSIFNTSMEVLLPMNPNLKIGQTIKLNFPVDTEQNEGIEEYDKYLTGKYIITKVRQIFTRTEMNTVLECTKDGGLA